VLPFFVPKGLKMPILRTVFTINDGDDDKATIAIRSLVDGTVTVDDLESVYAHPAWTSVVNLITGGLLKVTCEVEIDPSGWGDLRTSPSALSDVEEKATFKFQTVQGHEVIMTLPTVDESIFINSGAGKLVDLSNADVLAFIILMTEDLTNNGVDAVDSHGEDISRFIEGKQDFIARKSR
jgi:hypothetical protein